ncbi:hypothetical protein L1049_006462 [Liquidambar formosana]|uniref:Uncharacterized protein n=1 Tax=Liquidambar formosana TaxID=63359 RepID=A0AAP0WRF4_LIQFO
MASHVLRRGSKTSERPESKIFSSWRSTSYSFYLIHILLSFVSLREWSPTMKEVEVLFQALVVMGRERGIRVLPSNHLWVNFSFKHSKSRDVHAESSGDAPHDCEKGSREDPKQTREDPKQTKTVGMKQHRRCLESDSATNLN